MLSLKTQTTAPLFTKEDIPRIVAEAFLAAKTAEAAYRAKYGEPVWPCGFAIVKLKPANSAIAKYLKASGKGRTGYSSGLIVSNPGGSMTQNMDIKEAGADAFAEVLRAYGVTAYSESRMD